DIRQRKEYLYRKSIETEQRTLEKNKQKIKKAIKSSEEIPRELRKDAMNIAKEIEYEDEGGEGLNSHLDDEYHNAGIEDPRIVVSTSSKPSRSLQQFSKELCLLFPNS
ncbi:MAG: snoRNA-binding rRNA-processing protein imp4, partial [Marteilia pararefringens]